MTSRPLWRREEIVGIDETGWGLAVTKSGEPLRYPAAKLHRVPGGNLKLAGRRHPLRVDYLAGAELIRDFHSIHKPVVWRWLNRKAVFKRSIGTG